MSTAFEFLQKDAIGAQIQVTVVEDDVIVDLSTATTKTLYFRKPNGTTVSKTADFVTDGTDGKLKYVTESAFLDMAGMWNIQAYVQFPGGGYAGRGAVGLFLVESNL